MRCGEHIKSVMVPAPTELQSNEKCTLRSLSRRNAVEPYQLTPLSFAARSFTGELSERRGSDIDYKLIRPVHFPKASLIPVHFDTPPLCGGYSMTGH